MSIIAILTTIISGAELAVKAGEVASKLIPETPKELKDKFRWVKCTIKNETQFDVLLEASHFDSGRYWTPPGGFAKFSQSTFSCCNGDNTILTGATGGTAFRLSLDDKHFFEFALGWTAPAAGSYKASVVASKNPQEAYEAASATGTSIISAHTFEGKNKERVKIHISAAPGQEALFVIKQVPVHHDGH